jgi:hypothetical protein
VLFRVMFLTPLSAFVFVYLADTQTNSHMFGLASEICLLRLVEGIRIYK